MQVLVGETETDSVAGVLVVDGTQPNKPMLEATLFPEHAAQREDLWRELYGRFLDDNSDRRITIWAQLQDDLAPNEFFKRALHVRGGRLDFWDEVSDRHPLVKLYLVVFEGEGEEEGEGEGGEGEADTAQSGKGKAKAKAKAKEKEPTIAVYTLSQVKVRGNSGTGAHHTLDCGITTNRRRILSWCASSMSACTD